MTLITPVFDRFNLAQWFAPYYRSLGITRIVGAVWNGVKNPLYRWVGDVFDEVRPSVICDLSQYNGPAEVEGLNRIRQEFVEPNEWYVIADLDEFVKPCVGHFGELTKTARENGFQAVQGEFLDRVAGDGSMAYLTTALTLDEQFPIGCRLARSTTANCSKVSVARGDVAIMSGHHRVADGIPVWENGVEVHHFKWTAGVLFRTKQRLANFTRQGLPWVRESEEYVERLANEKIDLTDPRYEAKPVTVGA